MCMAVLKKQLWNGEPLKAVIKFGGGQTYTVFTSLDAGNSDNFIKQVDLNLGEGNSKVNPLGIATSNSINLQIYDKDDNLSPLNKKSPYYEKLVNGVEIDLFISYDGANYVPYGVYFTTAWSGGFSEGWHGLVNISAEDKLNTLGNYQLPDIPAYSNVQAGDLIANVMHGLGLTDTEYTIDPSINQTLLYGVAQGGKVRDFFNNICQLLFARVIIDRSGIVRFVPALKIYNTANELDIGPEYTGSFSNKNNNNINFNKVSVKYLEPGEIYRDVLFEDNSHILNDGTNLITDISFKHKALSVEQVYVLHDHSDATITSFGYRAYQNGIQLNINVKDGPINECSIVGEGMVVSTTDRSVTVDVDNATVVGGSTFEFDTKQMMTRSTASSIANNLKKYLSVISKNVILNGTALTPRLYVGDKIVIDGTDTLYDGVYKVINLDISIGEDYNLNATLIRTD